MADTANARIPSVEVTLFQPNLAPTRHTLRRSPTTLGRAAECTIPIKDRYLSRKHAEIVYEPSGWVIRDCGSANGTFVNGSRISGQVALNPGDRITLGDSALVFQNDAALTEPGEHEVVSLGDTMYASNLSLSVQQVVQDDLHDSRNPDRLKILNALAVELIEDRPMNELFDLILDRVMNLLSPSRAAMALITDDRKSFKTVKLRRREPAEASDLVISRTLLAQVVEEKKVLSFIDVAENEKLGQALSIIGQSIRSAVCAPLVVGESVLGVLYLDFLMSQGNIGEEDLRLVAQIARIAAVKLETTRLREEAFTKHIMEEELRTAYVVQSRLLPAAAPVVEGYTLAGVNRPCKTVSGDYYDFVVKPDGRVYFVIADVSGKGITAGLVMASLATAFNIFTRHDPTPSELVCELNKTLCAKLSPNKFVTLFAGILDPATGVIEFANAGHVPPLVVTSEGVSQLRLTDMIIGLFPQATYRDQRVTLSSGDAIILFTDGIIEAEDREGVELGIGPVIDLVAPLHRQRADQYIASIETTVREYVNEGTQGDDITLLALTRG